MFLALRDIRFAKGRFALMTGVVALVTLLLVLLSALTRGLGSQSTSAVTSLPASHVLLAPAGSTTTWGDSVIEPATVAKAASGVEPLLVTRARLQAGDATTSVAVFGTDASSRAASSLGTPLADGRVVLPREAADALGVASGSTVEVNGTPLVVSAVVDDQWYSHSPVAWTTRATAAATGHVVPGQATALLAPDQASADATARATGLESMARGASVNALPGYSSEHGSLLMIQGFLYGICALVVIAFLSVWTIQRTRDLAVLRAMGASRRYVLKDSLGQAGLLLALGALVGGLAGTGLAWAASRAVPVLVLPTTTLLPALGVALVGALGAVIATRRVVRIDPLLALGGN